MTAAAFDTIKLAEHLHGAGFTKKQASGLAEGLASALADHPRRDTVIEAIQDSAVNMTRRIDAAERRVGGQIEDLKSDVSAVKTDVTAVKGDVSAVKTDVTAVKGDVSGVKADMSAVKVDIADMKAEHGAKFLALETMLGKLLEGQAVLLQNDMELRRRLERRD